MNGEPESSGGCGHPILFFGTRGFYVVCSKCSYVWVARDPLATEDKPDENFRGNETGQRIYLTDETIEAVLRRAIPSSQVGAGELVQSIMLEFRESVFGPSEPPQTSSKAIG